jgi:hypothetical protein
MLRNPRGSGDFFMGEIFKAGVYRLAGRVEMTRPAKKVISPAIVDNYHPFICIISAK